MLRATEGASSKKTLGTNLSGRWNHNGTHLWRARKQQYATKGEDSMIDRVKLSGKRTGKGKQRYVTLFCPFLRPKKVVNIFFRKAGK